jgi:hypothetical protein
MLKSLGQWTYIAILYLFIGTSLPGEEIIAMIPAPPGATLNDRASSVKPCGLVTARADYISLRSMEETVEFYRHYARDSGWREFKLSGYDAGRLSQSEE